MRVASLHTYPIKSGYRVDTDTAEVEPWGLAGDRRWMVTDPDGQMLTQRKVQTMVRLRPQYTEKGLLLKADGHEDLDLAAPGGEDLTSVRVWRDVLDAAPAGGLADDWVSAVIERPARLFYLDDPTRRSVEEGFSEPDDRVSFADGYPLLLTTTASLAALNDWLLEAGEEPVPMTRFRPNVVVDGAGPWAEDGWVGSRLRIGSVTFRAPKLCGRCVLTTVDAETGGKSREPLRTLGRYRRTGDGLMFGLNLVPDQRGTLSVGDPVDVWGR